MPASTAAAGSTAHSARPLLALGHARARPRGACPACGCPLSPRGTGSPSARPGPEKQAPGRGAGRRAALAAVAPETTRSATGERGRRGRADGHLRACAAPARRARGALPAAGRSSRARRSRDAAADWERRGVWISRPGPRGAGRADGLPDGLQAERLWVWSPGRGAGLAAKELPQGGSRRASSHGSAGLTRTGLVREPRRFREEGARPGSCGVEQVAWRGAPLTWGGAWLEPGAKFPQVTLLRRRQWGPGWGPELGAPGTHTRPCSALATAATGEWWWVPEGAFLPVAEHVLPALSGVLSPFVFKRDV